MIRWLLGVAVILIACAVPATANPCSIIVVGDPGGVARDDVTTDPDDMQTILSKVVATGGRIISSSKVDLPLATTEPMLLITSRDGQVTFVLANNDADWSDPLDQVVGDQLYSEKTPPAFDGIGKIYLGREISQVMGHLGAGWLERSEREQEERTDLLVELMALEPDDVVADIGSGTGYFSLRIAPNVPEGKVVAVDIQPEMNALLEENARNRGIKNVETILGEIDDARIPAETVDVVLFVDAYHEFSHPWEMKRSLMKALRPGGRVVLVEYRAEDPTVRIKPHHKMTEQQARHEFESAGFEWVTTLDDLPQQHVLIFKKPEAQAEAG